MICWSYCVQPRRAGEEGALVASFGGGKLLGHVGALKTFPGGQGRIGVYHILRCIPGDLTDDAEFATVLDDFLLINILGNPFAMT